MIYQGRLRQKCLKKIIIDIPVNCFTSCGFHSLKCDILAAYLKINYILIISNPGDTVHMFFFIVPDCVSVNTGFYTKLKHSRIISCLGLSNNFSIVHK